MLEITRIREEANKIVENLKKRKFDAQALIQEVLEKDKLRREYQTKQDEVKAQLNGMSKEIGNLFKSGQVDLANQAKEKTTQLKATFEEYKDKFEQVSSDLQNVLFQIPNVPKDQVPSGVSEDDNVEVYKNDVVVEFDGFEPKAHWDIAKDLDLIDFETGVKVTGAGFPIYKGKGAKLQRALISYFLEKAEDAGYVEHIPPHLVNEASGYGTGQLPDKEGQMYHVTEDDLYLIPTAEVPLTNMYRDTILKEKDFPIKVCGYTPCFRREAGSYGKDVRGLNRLHQFDKVEIVQLSHPHHSEEALEEMKDHVAELLTELQLPYRILRLCGGDLGFTSAITYDFEVWSAAQKRWLEVSSVSNFETFQANRLKLRYQSADGKKHLAHTLNGSALALPRILAAVLENYQTAEGVHVPVVLQKYLRFKDI